MSIWVLTGMSGGGKQTALRALEAAGVACIDNLPVQLLEPLRRQPPQGTVAVVLDGRQGAALESFPAEGEGLRTVFLDARDDVLVRRMSESTRPHPAESHGRGLAAVAAERELLVPLRAAADVVIDTSDMTAGELGQRVLDVVAGSGQLEKELTVTISSFGFKHGAQPEADWVVDARMMRNPFWDHDLRPLTGLDEPVRRFVLDQPETGELVRRLSDLFAWALPEYAAHGRRHLHLAVGCTGGRHRSVVIAEALAESLRRGDHRVVVRHRDVRRPDPRD